MIEDRARYHGYNVGRGVGVVFAFSYMAVRAASGSLTWGQAVAGVLYGITAGAVTYTVIYLAYNMIPGLAVLTTVRQNRQPEPEYADSYDPPAQPLPLRETRYLTIGTSDYLVPAELINAVEAIQEQRMAGNFRTISANALDDAGVADRRNGQADRVIAFLERIGAIVSTGDRRPYEWTATGEITFPLPHTFGATSRLARPVADSRGSRQAVAATDWGGGEGDWQ